MFKIIFILLTLLSCSAPTSSSIAPGKDDNKEYYYWIRRHPDGTTYYDVAIFERVDESNVLMDMCQQISSLSLEEIEDNLYSNTPGGMKSPLKILNGDYVRYCIGGHGVTVCPGGEISEIYEKLPNGNLWYLYVENPSGRYIWTVFTPR